MTDIILSPHFNLSEFVISQTAARYHIDNAPSLSVMARLKFTAENLEKVRSLLGHPVLVSSGYRSPELNIKVGGVANSQHCLGEAADFTCPAFGDVEAVFHIIETSHIPYDQLIIEFGRWVHISFTSERAPRREAFRVG